MIEDALAQPHQIADARWRVESAAIPRREASGLAVCGTGAAALGGELAAAAIGDRARGPIRTVSGPLERWTRPDTLVLCASYSGDCERTLESFESAGALGAPRVAVTTGGRLAAAAREQRVPVVGVPSGMPPRAAIVYMTVAPLGCAALGGVAPSPDAELDAAAALLAELATRWGPDAPDDSPAKALARRLERAIPLVYGGGLTAPVARRWAAQLREEAGVPAFAEELPVSVDDARFAPVVLDGGDGRSRGADSVEAEGETAAERMLSLVLLGDLVAAYLGARIRAG
jgi:glucose/mannose-6-phosphate isomerase